MSYCIYLSPNELYPRVRKFGTKKSARSCNDLTKLRNIFLYRGECIFRNFGINFEINIIHPACRSSTVMHETVLELCPPLQSTCLQSLRFWLKRKHFLHLRDKYNYQCSYEGCKLKQREKLV